MSLNLFSDKKSIGNFIWLLSGVEALEGRQKKNRKMCSLNDNIKVNIHMNQT